MIVTAHIDISTPKGREIVEKLKAEKETVKLEFPNADYTDEYIAEHVADNVDDVFDRLSDKLNKHYGSNYQLK